jgi:hypothetical protein
MLDQAPGLVPIALGPSTALGTNGSIVVGKSALVFLNGGCSDCFARTASSLDPSEPDVATQALAALAWQRIALGLAEPLGSVGVELLHCESHR